MINLSQTSVVYVLCPAYLKTGGPELLHQLVYTLNTNKVNAKITYYNCTENKNYTNADFKKYITDSEVIDNIIDDENNIIIIPETSVDLIKRFKKIRTAIWWLSVDNYKIMYEFKKRKEIFGLIPAIKTKIKHLLKGYTKKMIYTADYHLCQSYYAVDFLKDKGINNSIYLSDYINDSYLNTKTNNLKKDNIVLYNPKKGFEFTQKIIAKSPNLKWKPIENMTTEQVKKLLLKSKVYIDFGNHPGKDRFPRETAICGCCVITGKRGSAKYDKDVPISSEFKFDDIDTNIDKVILKINECLDNYDKEIKKFEKYRKYIISEKKKFNDDVKKIFVIKN